MPSSLNGTGVTFNDATTLQSGNIPAANLGSGTANSSTFLRGDKTWATVSGGVTSLNGQSGAITNTSLNSIGSYALANQLNQTANPGLVVNSTYSPANLWSYSAAGDWTSFSSYGLTGTWRCMPGARTAPPGSSYYSVEAPVVRVS